MLKSNVPSVADMARYSCSSPPRVREEALLLSGFAQRWPQALP
jgi:hypothetical protein